MAGMASTEHPFWACVAPFLAAGDLDQGTLMGGRCVRAKGDFVAIPWGDDRMVVKLPRDRVAALIEAGEGRPFSPNGRVFREWLDASPTAPTGWDALLREGLGFAGRV